MTLVRLKKKFAPHAKKDVLSVDESIRIAESYLGDKIAPERFDEAISTLIETVKHWTRKVKGWVARDEDQSLWLHYNKPRQIQVSDGGYTLWIWYSDDSQSRQIVNKNEQMLFMDLKWGDEPLRVELVFRLLD